MTRNDFNHYLDELRRRCSQGFFLARSFRTAEEWNRWSSFEFRARASSGDGEPQLGNVLYHRRTVILGEAGSGKSAVARRTIDLSAENGFIPIFVQLKSYGGDLTALVRGQASEDILRAADVDGAPAARLYIFDGLDEVPAQHVDDFFREFNELADNEPNSRVLLTSRQAFFVARQQRLDQPFQVFYILDFSDRDVDAVIQNAGADRATFREAATRAHLSQELGNPLALNALLKMFRDRGSLGATRSDALQHVVDSALASRPTGDPRRQKRALRMLALAMEVAAKNQLTNTEAQQVLERSLRNDAAAARQLLEDLTQSVLVRTPIGYTFPLHSYGEYLAAEELSEIQETDRILRLMYIGNTHRPADSWRNCVSYLLERHRGARSRFSRRYPSWTLTSSPAVFDEQDRTAIVTELLASMVNDYTYLLRHPTIRAIDLARFVPESMLPQLRAAVESVNDVEAANAALLLAAYGDRTLADRLLELSLDPRRNSDVRNSALAAFDQIGTPASVERLLDIQDWNEPTVLSRVDAAAGLMDSTNTTRVLAALGRTDAMISTAFYRFDELENPADLEAVLDALIALPNDAFGSRMSYYLARFWRSLARDWRPAWADKVAQVVMRFEEIGNLDDGDLRSDFVPAMQSLPDHGHAIGRATLERLLAAGRDVNHLYHSIPALVGPADGQWLLQQPGAERLLRTVSAFAPRGTSELLRSPITPEQQEQIDRMRREEERRQARTQRLENTIATSEDTDSLYRALVETDPSRWPEVTAARLNWLAGFVGEKLGELDLRTGIRWTSETELTMPRPLPLLLALVRRYELRLADDRPLALALIAETHATRTYHQRFGVSEPALGIVEQFLNDATTSNPGLEHVLRFIHDAKLATPRIIAGVEHVAADAARPNRVRETAVQIVADAGEANALLRIAPTLSPDVRRQVEDRLVETQHRSTIERRLQQLLDDPVALASGEVDIHINNPLNWVASIRLREVWDRLTRLRRLALQRGLDRVASLFTNTLYGIDGLEAVRVIRAQMADTSPAWQPILQARALELERDATIRLAQGAPFETVLRRLENARTLNRFKIWVEGPTDCMPVEDLARRMPGAEHLNMVAQSLGGWGTILAAQWTPHPLGDGCHDFVMLLDGDGAYDYSRPGLVLKPEVRPFLARLQRDGIEVKVLDRYGLENYFPQHAFESVIGRDLRAHFPLDPRRPVNRQIPGYNKNMNTALARLTTHADLAGTDLGTFLERVERLARD
jgi:hypothetical protein